MTKKKYMRTNESTDKPEHKTKTNRAKHKYSTRMNEMISMAAYNVNEFAQSWNEATNDVDADIEGTRAIKAANQSVTRTDSPSQGKAMYGRLLPNGLDVS
jgi:hypothetical protein